MSDAKNRGEESPYLCKFLGAAHRAGPEMLNGLAIPQPMGDNVGGPGASLVPQRRKPSGITYPTEASLWGVQSAPAWRAFAAAARGGEREWKSTTTGVSAQAGGPFLASAPARANSRSRCLAMENSRPTWAGEVLPKWKRAPCASMIPSS